jgi:hypothetical protein
VVYSPHYPGISSHFPIDGKGMWVDGYDGNKTRLKESLESVVRLSEQWNQPVFIGEWGICVEGANATQYTNDLADLMDRYLISWTWWTYGKASFGMCLLNEASKERIALIQNLERIYARCSSAPPSSSSYDLNKKEFQVDVKGPSVVAIYLPTLYAALITVKIDKGSARWTIDEHILTVYVPIEASRLTIR